MHVGYDIKNKNIYFPHYTNQISKKKIEFKYTIFVKI